MARRRKEPRLGFVDFCRIDDKGKVHCDARESTRKKFGVPRWLPVEKEQKSQIKGKPGPHSTKVGSGWKAKDGSPFFSSTSKVHTPTWGIPPAHTCPMIAEPVLEWLKDAVQHGKDKKPVELVTRLMKEVPRKCLACYATTGNYVYAETQQAMANRMDWFNNTSDKEVEDTLVHAIKHAGNEECSPKSGCKYTPGVQSKYFRAFDAGDFQSARDIRIWHNVAKRLPDTRFWFPTTAWNGVCGSQPEERAAMRKALESLHSEPNVTVRPSAPGMDVPAAKVSGLGEGTAVVEKVTAHRGAETYYGGKERKKGNWTRICDKDTQSCVDHWVCPGNCALCRKCWSKDVPVVYKRHGLKPNAKNILKLVRKVVGIEQHKKSSKSAAFERADTAIRDNFAKLFAKISDGPVPTQLVKAATAASSTELKEIEKRFPTPKTEKV